MSILSSIMLLVLQLFQNLWSNGMPITVNNIGISGHQQSARRFQEITHDATEILPFHDTKKERFISELFHNNGSCFMWSSNVLMLDAWIPFNCTYRVPKPFIVCEGKIKVNAPQNIYKRPDYKCALMFLVFKGHCIRVTMNINNSQILQRKEYTETNLDSVLTRILTARTIPVYTGNKNETLHVIKWIDNEICECYLSRNITYMENKVWHSDSCSCEIKQKIFIMTKQSRSVIPNMLVSCDDGNFHHVRCDGIIDCQLKEDEDNCSHVCSKYINCTSNCTLPDCICAPLYHHCTLGGCVQRSVVCDGVLGGCVQRSVVCDGVLGGCVQRSVVCDGVVDCVNDDSDELACSILPNPDAQKKQLPNYDVSLCNSFSNKTYPNTEICLLVRDVYGVTKHCPNTEHLHYCADFRCPNHYKCQDSYCIPLHTVCDGVMDCPEGQDEDHCRDFTCRGFVRCKGMQVCIHTDYLCNGIIDCPVYGDDEMFCDNLSCPNFCKCFGFTVSCAEVTLPSIKYISILAQSKAIALISCMFKSYDIMFKHFQFLQILNLSNTYFMKSLYPNNFTHMTQLRILDLTNASINLNSRKIFTNMNSLMHFYLAHTHASRLQLEIF